MAANCTCDILYDQPGNPAVYYCSECVYAVHEAGYAKCIKKESVNKSKTPLISGVSIGIVIVIIISFLAYFWFSRTEQWSY